MEPQVASMEQDLSEQTATCLAHKKPWRKPELVLLSEEKTEKLSAMWEVYAYFGPS